MAITAPTTNPESQSQAVPPATTPTTATSKSSSAAAVPSPATPEVECAKCESCGFTEDCTPAYISRVRDRFHGRWICGLCVEAVKDELLRSDRLISTEEALHRHISFCSSFRSSGAAHQMTEHPISAIGRIFRRSLDSPRAIRSSSASSLDVVKTPPLLRSGSLSR